MKILKYSLFCCMLGIVSCSTNSNSKQLDKISNLKGEWLISSSFGAMCNVCPELVFFDSSRGSIEKPSKESYDFKYEINKDKISFKFEEGQEYIDLDSEFSYNVKSDSILRYLTLVSLDNSGELILISEK